MSESKDNVREFPRAHTEHASASRTAYLVGMMRAVCDAIDAAGPMGAPGGILYAGLMSLGVTADNYNVLMSSMEKGGLVVRHNQCYTLTQAGELFLMKCS